MPPASPFWYKLDAAIQRRKSASQGSSWSDAAHHSCDSPSPSVRAIHLCIVGESPTCSVPALWTREGLRPHASPPCMNMDTPPPLSPVDPPPALPRLPKTFVHVVPKGCARPDGGREVRAFPRHRQELRHQGLRHRPLLERPHVPRAQLRSESYDAVDACCVYRPFFCQGTCTWPHIRDAHHVYYSLLICLHFFLPRRLTTKTNLYIKPDVHRAKTNAQKNTGALPAAKTSVHTHSRFLYTKTGAYPPKPTNDRQVRRVPKTNAQKQAYNITIKTINTWYHIYIQQSIFTWQNQRKSTNTDGRWCVFFPPMSGIGDLRRS